MAFIPAQPTSDEPIFDRLSKDEQETIIEVIADCLVAQAQEDLARKKTQAKRRRAARRKRKKGGR